MTDNKEDSDLEKALIGLSKCEQQMDLAEKDAEIYRITKTSKIYQQRRELLLQIPNFWYIVIAQNEDFSDYIRNEDLKYLENLQDLFVKKMVKDDDEESTNPGDFAITFKFGSFDDSTPEQEVTKYFQTVQDDNGEEKLTSKSVLIQWPVEYNDINPSMVKDKSTKEGKKMYRTGMKSVFAWFKWTGLKPGKEFRQGDDLARLICDEIFPYAVKYYTEAMPGLGEDDEESSEELELSDDSDDDSESSQKRKLSDSEDEVSTKKQK